MLKKTRTNEKNPGKLKQSAIDVFKGYLCICN